MKTVPFLSGDNSGVGVDRTPQLKQYLVQFPSGEKSKPSWMHQSTRTRRSLARVDSNTKAGADIVLR